MNLMDGLHEELARARKLLSCYEGIPTGTFGYITTKQAINQAEQSIQSGDVTEMLVAYKVLKNLK